MWIDLAGVGVLVCNLDGAWMNRALTVAWRGQGRRDRGSDWSSVCGRRTRARSVLAHRFSLSLSLCASEARSENGLKVK